jgi:phosphoribosylaminoimidazolecarboxamide formyltransferase / IMP cyclohydrolase
MSTAKPQASTQGTKRRALLSVFDKTGLVNFAVALRELGFELVASGGTSSELRAHSVAHHTVESVTGAPEMLHGRVKTLHPKIHGGILANRAVEADLEDLRVNEIDAFHLVVCNLYPFTSNPSVDLIDVGGPTMVRAAAKNHEHVAIVVDPADYAAVIDELRSEIPRAETSAPGLSLVTRHRLARKAFAHTASYDAAIVTWFDNDVLAADELNAPGGLPPTLHLSLERADSLRYGENPHQSGARYRATGIPGCLDGAIQHGGKELSYLNVYDVDAAWRLVHDLAAVADDAAAVAIIKHANPCGTAVASDIATAYRLAHECDPVSAFGGVVASSRVVTEQMAEDLAPVFTEVVVAPGFDPKALALLTARKNLRVIEAPAPDAALFTVRSIAGGYLLQTRDEVIADVMNRESWTAPTDSQPDDDILADLILAWTVCAHVSSNAIVIGSRSQAVGIGAGQQSRVDAAKIAVTKAGARALGGVAASDAFFPFRDGLDVLADAGVRAVIQPGGSVRDDEVIAAANERGIAMVLTGRRHFRH